MIRFPPPIFAVAHRGHLRWDRHTSNCGPVDRLNYRGDVSTAYDHASSGGFDFMRKGLGSTDCSIRACRRCPDTAKAGSNGVCVSGAKISTWSDSGAVLVDNLAGNTNTPWMGSTICVDLAELPELEGPSDDADGLHRYLCRDNRMRPFGRSVFGFHRSFRAPFD